MASGKRQPSKQKRQNQNRQQRAAREARTTNASARPAAASSSSSGGGAAPARSGGLLGRLRGGAAGAAAGGAERPARPTRTASPRSSAGASGSAAAGASGDPFTDKRGQPVGYRAALTGLLAAVAAVVVSFFVSQHVNGQGDVYTPVKVITDWSRTALHSAQAHPGGDTGTILKGIDVWLPERGSNRMFLTYYPWTLAALLPIVASYFAFRSVQQRRGAKAVNRAMYATMAGAFLCLPLLQFFLPTVIAVAVAGWQVRRAELTALRAAGLVDARGRPIPQGGGATGAAGAVIEADVVDDDADGAGPDGAGGDSAEVVEPAADEVDDGDDGDDGEPVVRPSTDTLLGRLRGGTSGSADPSGD
jgi:hypothetical protein